MTKPGPVKDTTLNALAAQAVDHALDRAGITRADFLADFPVQGPEWIEEQTEYVREFLDCLMTSELQPPDLVTMAAEERWAALDRGVDAAADRINEWKEN